MLRAELRAFAAVWIWIGGVACLAWAIEVLTAGQRGAALYWAVAGLIVLRAATLWGVHGGLSGAET